MKNGSRLFYRRGAYETEKSELRNLYICGSTAIFRSDLSLFPVLQISFIYSCGTFCCYRYSPNKKVLKIYEWGYIYENRSHEKSENIRMDAETYVWNEKSLGLMDA